MHSPGNAAGLGGVFRFQMVDVCTVGVRKRRALNEENVLSVKLRASRKIIRTSDYRIVDYKHLVVHVVVVADRRVGR